MERLTNRNYGEISRTGRIIPYSTHCIGCITEDCDCGIVEDMVKKLADYEDLEEQGRLIILPCKLGDVVYVPTRDFISELRIVHITVSKNNMFFHWILNIGIYPNLDGFSSSKIGETVFLTKSEAEAKLKELRGESNGSME
nr:MAG TPA: hypothetical protein [Caudoviricetes sp.]